MPSSVSKVPYIKVHRAAIVTFALADTWYDIPFDVISETSYGGQIAYVSPVFTYNGPEDVLVGAGCLRPRRDSGATNNQSIAARAMVKHPGGEWTEARCLQNAILRNWPANEVLVLPMAGSVSVLTGTQIKLQARVSGTGIQLEGWPTFDSPVAASFLFMASGSFVGL
jgi:hypothetical protein